MTIIDLARSVGAHAIARDAVGRGSEREVVRLGKRLRLHLHELRRALDRSDAELTRDLDAIASCIILTGHLLDDRARRPDPDRAKLERTLATERTKFLMSVKADARLRVTDAVAATSSDADLRRVALAVAESVGAQLVVAWRDRIGGVLTAAATAMGARLLGEARASFGPLLDWVPMFASVDAMVVPVRGALRLRTDPEHLTGGALTRLGDRMRLPGSVRRRAETLGAGSIVWLLETNSLVVVEEALAAYDRATRETERSLGCLLDQMFETAQVSLMTVRDAREDQAVREERARIDAWLARLAELMQPAT